MQSVSMSRPNDHPESLVLGQALAALRRGRGMSQAEAGARLGMTSQAWGLYEAGRRPGLFRPDVQRRLTGALDMTPEDLALEIVRAGATAPSAPERRVSESGRTYSINARAGTGRRQTLQLSHDNLAPWAGSGVTLVYDDGVWPRSGQGCVAMTDGGRVIGLYDRGDAEAVYLRDVAGGERRLERCEITSLGAILARLEGVDWPE